MVMGRNIFRKQDPIHTHSGTLAPIPTGMEDSIKKAYPGIPFKDLRIYPSKTTLVPGQEIFLGEESTHLYHVIVIQWLKEDRRVSGENKYLVQIVDYKNRSRDYPY